jgi:glycosyltransferase involved in cell wall biosynthesis
VSFLRECGHAVELIRPRQPHDAGRAAITQLDAEGNSEWLAAGMAIPVYRDLRMGFMSKRRLVKQWKQRRPQLVHVATPGPLGWSAVAAANELGITATSDFRTNFQQYGQFYGVGCFAPLVHNHLRRFHNKTQLTFVPTHSMESTFAAEGFERLAVVGRGVDAERFRPSRRSNDLRARWGVEGDAPVLLQVGRLAREKNIQLAMRAYAAALAQRPDARMVVVGDGPLRQALEARHPEVRFVGAQSGDALAACYASADIFLFPSLTDTFGNVTLEAMASGLAVLAYDTAAAQEHIAHGESGVVVRPGDETAFIQAACQMTACPETLDTMRVKAREVALDTSWDAVLRGFESHLLEAAHAGDAKPSDLAVCAA